MAKLLKNYPEFDSSRSAILAANKQSKTRGAAVYRKPNGLFIHMMFNEMPTPFDSIEAHHKCTLVAYRPAGQKWITK
jgi:hypothetical protein